MAGDVAAGEQTPARPSVPRDTANSHNSFRPILVLLSSLTADNIEAAVVARLLQPRFKPGDFYIINAATFATPNTSPAEAKKGGGANANNNNNNTNAGRSSVSPGSTPGSTSESISSGVQGELARIGAAREAARQAAAQAKAAQLTTLQAEYVEDGLTAEEALAAAQAELRDQSNSDDDEADEDGETDGRGGDGSGERISGDERGRAGLGSARRLPPCVCVLNVPLTCSAVDRLARAVPNVAAAFLLESRCCIRDLVSSGGVPAPAGGAAGAAEKSKGRGAGGGGSASPPNAKDGPAYTDDLVEYLNGGVPQLLEDGAGLPNLLLQRLPYPTESTSASAPAPPAGTAAAPVTFRPTAPPAQFVGTLHALLLRVLQAWLRYTAWSTSRVSVRVPPYVPLRDADAGGEWGTNADDFAVSATVAASAERRLSKRKSGAPSATSQDNATAVASAVGGAAAEATSAAATTAAHPRTMADVAAEQFEYGAYLQQWARGHDGNAPHGSPRDAVLACVAACVHQVSSGHGTCTLRSRGEASAAQLDEDVRAATAMCDDALRAASGAAGTRQVARLSKLSTLVQLQERAWQLPIITAAAAAAVGPMPNIPANAADTLEGAVASLMAEGEAAAAAAAAAVVATPGDGDVLHWLHGVLVAREQLGWVTSASHGKTAALCCLRRPALTHCLAHTAFVFRGPTTFAQFYRDEQFLESEEHAYELTSSAGSDSDEEDEELEEEADDDVAEAGDSDADSSTSTHSTDSTARRAAAAAAASAAAPPSKFAAAAAPSPVPTGPPPVDHVGIIESQLLRRRVLKQVARCHERPAVQELGVSAGRCRDVVVETSWVGIAGGGVIEVSRTVANSCQVQCAVSNDAVTIRGGFMLECPPAHVSARRSVHSKAATDAAAGSDAPPPPVQPQASQPAPPLQSPEPVVESGVRGFLEVDDRLRVFTAVVADNSHAVRQAQYAIAVAAAKEAAVAQHEAQFSKGAKTAKGRDRGATSTAPLTLEDITESLLAALPPPPQDADGAEEGSASPPAMRVHALFPLHHCVVTAVQSQTAVPGVRLQLLPESSHLSSDVSMAVASALMTVHLWWDDQLCTVALRRISAAQVYVDGVAEIFSDELPPGTRVLLHPSGGYVASSAAQTLFVSAGGRCVLCESVGEAAPTVVHTLHAGWAAAVTGAATTRFEREDGMRQEFSSDATAGSPKTLTKTFFGEHVAVLRSSSGEAWSWCIAGLPRTTADSATRQIAVALDATNGDVWTYQPDEAAFALQTRTAADGPRQVAAALALRESRMKLWSDTQRGSAVVVDCAYGGLYGCGVSATASSSPQRHLYRVSPFGRVSEEVAATSAVSSAGPVSWQLVLPPQYKRPRRKEPEVVLRPEYASDAFHRACHGGAAGRGGGEPTRVMHLQRTPPELQELSSKVDAASLEMDEVSDVLQDTLTAAQHGGPQVRCVALPGGAEKTSAVVMDAASWTEYARWLTRLPGKTVRQLTVPTTASPSAFPVKVFEVADTTRNVYELLPLTAADADAVARRPPPPSQRCAVVYGLTKSSTGSPAWQTSGELTAALRTVVAPLESDEALPKAFQSPVDGGDTAVREQGDDQTAPAVEAVAVQPPPKKEETAPATASPAPTTSTPTAARRGGALNFWTSPCCPADLQLTMKLVAAAESRANTAVSGGAKRADDAAAADTTASTAPAAGAVAAPPSSTRSPKTIHASSKAPLMQSYLAATDAQTGTTASSRFHAPLLVVEPRHIDFGNVQKGRRYVAKVAVANTSTVPCRYRVRTSPAVRPYLVVSYPRHFVAPGMTVEVVVELSGWQPHGVVDAELTIVHEGGATEVGVVWCTTDATQEVQMGPGVVCAGWSVTKPALQHPSKRAAAEAAAGADGDEPNSGSDNSLDLDVPQM